jgi:hypothetical protein
MLQSHDEYLAAKKALTAYEKAVVKCKKAPVSDPTSEIPIAPEVEASLRKQAEDQSKLPFTTLREYVEAYEFFNLDGINRITLPCFRKDENDMILKTQFGTVELGKLSFGKKLPYAPSNFGIRVRRQAVRIKASNGGVYEGVYFFGNDRINVRRVK